MKKWTFALALMLLLGALGFAPQAAAENWTEETARAHMEEIALLAESAYPGQRKYHDVAQEALAPFAAQVGEDFFLYSRQREDGPLYIMLLPKDHVTVPEIAGQDISGDSCGVVDAKGNTFLTVTGASELSFSGQIGVIWCYEGFFDNILEEPLPNIFLAAENPALLTEMLEAGVYSQLPEGEIGIEFYAEKYNGCYVIEKELQEKIEKQMKSLGKGEKFTERDSLYSTNLYLRKGGDDDFGGFLLSDGSMGNWDEMRHYPEIAEYIHAALDDFQAKTGFDPRGFDFDNIDNLVSATLEVSGFGGQNNPAKQTVTDAEKLQKLAKMFRDSAKTGSGKCPFGGKLTLEKENGEKIEIMIATDSCDTAEIRHGGFAIGIEYGKGREPRSTMEGIFEEISWE